MISIGLPVYNAEKYLCEAIESVIAQSLTDWELIVTDDGSTDKSVEIVKHYLYDKRIRLIVDGEHRGISYRLNQQVMEAKGDFFARMDADDVMLKDRLAVQLEYMREHPNVDICGTMAGQWTFIHPSVMGRIGWFRSNPYRPECDGCEDWDLWLRTRQDSEFGFVKQPLIYYRKSSHLDKEKYLNRRAQGRTVIRLDREYLGEWRYYWLMADSYLKSWIVWLFVR